MHRKYIHDVTEQGDTEHSLFPIDTGLCMIVGAYC